jgi:hypothetical protein
MHKPSSANFKNYPPPHLSSHQTHSFSDQSNIQTFNNQANFFTTFENQDKFERSYATQKSGHLQYLQAQLEEEEYHKQDNYVQFTNQTPCTAPLIVQSHGVGQQYHSANKPLV